MSYDVSLYINGGGTATVEAFWRNHTSNTACMWKDAGLDLRGMDGAPAVECGGAVSRAADRIAADADSYRRMEPDNGWGSVQSTVDFLRAVAEACERFPAATVEVSS
jgi:hypothetical protein